LQKGDPVRTLLAVAVLLVTASCAAPLPPPQQQGANCPAARKELSAIARARAKASDPPPTDATSPAQPVPPPSAAVAYRPWFPLALPLFRAPPHAGRLTLSNFSFGLADVEAFVTSSGECAFHPGVVPQHRNLPLDAAWIIPAPPGSDVCWRRLSPDPPSPSAQGLMLPAPPAAEWNRAFTAAGRFIDARL